MKDGFSTPILFLIFNRPETTARVFDAVRRAKPKDLYVAADGPRSNKPSENELCELSRKIATNIDWDCNVKTLFRKENLGCKNAIESALDWFFNDVDKGIILEDDCLPNNSFFLFCEKMLHLYEDNPKISIISGYSVLKGKYTRKDDYCFSKHFDMWGWASWSKIWKLNKKTIFAHPEEIYNRIYKRYKHTEFCHYIYSMIESSRNERFNSWAVIFQYYLMLNDLISIIPYKNLISNIGEHGTHNTSVISPFLNTPTYEIDFDKHSINKEIEVNTMIDLKIMNIVVKGNKKADGKISKWDALVNKFNDSYKYRKQKAKKFFLK